MNTGTPPTITLAIEHPARPKKMRTITAARALIGRETGDLVLEDPEASAVHAEIDCTQGHVIVRDLGSSNGTWRGAERLPQFALLAGQSFRCGATTITLVSVEGAPTITAGRTIVRVHDEAPQRSGPTAPWAPQSAAPPRAAPSPSVDDSREVTVVARPSDDELESLRSTANLPRYNAAAEREVTEVRAKPTTGVPDDDDDDGAEPAGATLRAPTLARTSAPARDTLFPATDEFRPPIAADSEASTATLPGGTPTPIVDAPSPAITLPHGTLPDADVPPSRATQPREAFANATEPNVEAAMRLGATQPNLDAALGRAGATPPDITVPNATMPVQHMTQPAPTMPAQGTVPTPAVGEQRRPPVANALIKPGGRPATGPSPIVAPKPPRKLGRIVGFSALAVAIVAMIGAAGWFAVKWFRSRGSVLATTIARDLPDDTLGFVAWASPRTQIEIVGDAVPEPARKDMTARLGFDPLDVAAIAELGVDPDAPMGVAWIDVGKPTIVVSFGVSDEGKLRAAIPEKAAKLMGIAKLEVTDRSFENVPALWIETPLPTAVLLRSGRATAIVGLPGSDSANVARHAERVAKVERSTSLAARPGFTELRREPGDPLMVLYVDGVSARTAIPGSAAEMLAARVAFGEIDAMAVTLSRDGPRTHLAVQTVMREGTPGLRYVADVSRSGKALDRIPGPGLAAADAAFAAEPSVQAVVGLLTVTGAITEIERDFKEASNLDLRTDVLDNIGGEVGAALLKLPSTRGMADFTMVAYASVKDEEKAAKSLAAALPALQHLLPDTPVTSETIGGTAVHTFTLGGAVSPPAGAEVKAGPVHWSVFVTAGHLWIAYGDVDPRTIIDKTGKSLRDSARNDAIADALAPGDTLSMFVDLKGLLAALDPLLAEADRKEKADAEPAWGPIEVITVRGSTEDRIGRVRITLHTNADDGFTALVRGLLKVQGAQFASALEQQRRAGDCARHIEHLTQIATTDNSRTIQSYEVRDVCESKATPEAIACAAKATTFAEIATCGGAEAGLLPPEPEPQAVPYVEDIWPNTRSEAGDGGRPRADVNYGVDVGTDAQIRGRADALVTIIEFGDFQCPYCREVTATLDEVLARHGDDVRLVFRHNPLAMHAEAKNAAKAALAAARQGKFWAMHDKLFESQYELAGKYRDFAGAIGLDLAQFDADFADPALDRRIEEDQGAAQRFGVTGTPAFFINGRFLSGGQPLAVFESVITEELGRARTFVERRGNTRKRLYDDMINRFAPEVARAGAAPLPPDSGERFTIATTGLPQRGATGFSRVSLIECGDFECPYCQRATRALDRVVADYASLVTVYFMHNPLSFHTNAEAAARAAVAADKQGKFWEMHDKLYADLDAHTEADFLAYAKELKLDVDKFKADMAAPETAATVADQKKICTEKGGSSTPTFFLNGRRIEGAQPYETFKTLIDAQLSGGI